MHGLLLAKVDKMKTVLDKFLTFEALFCIEAQFQKCIRTKAVKELNLKKEPTKKQINFSLTLLKCFFLN